MNKKKTFECKTYSKRPEGHFPWSKDDLGPETETFFALTKNLPCVVAMEDWFLLLLLLSTFWLQIFYKNAKSAKLFLRYFNFIGINDEFLSKEIVKQEILNCFYAKNWEFRSNFSEINKEFVYRRSQTGNDSVHLQQNAVAGKFKFSLSQSTVVLH